MILKSLADLKQVNSLKDVSFVVVPEHLFLKRKSALPVVLTEIKAWVDLNCVHSAYICNMTPLTTKTDDISPIMVFESYDESKKFSEWIETFSDEFMKREYELLWNDKTTTRGYDVYYKLEKYDGSKYKSVVCIDTYSIFVWIKQNISGDVWRVDNNFYFSDKNDALKFKLRWVGM